MTDYRDSAFHPADCTCADCERAKSGERAWRERRLTFPPGTDRCDADDFKGTTLICQCAPCQKAALAKFGRPPTGRPTEPLPDVDYDLAAVLLEEVSPSPRATMPIKCAHCSRSIGWVHATKRAAVRLSCEGCVREGRAW